VRDEELTPWLIRYAYERGAFPMADDDGTVEWYLPEPRCLFPIEGIHVSRSLAKAIRRGTFEIRFDTAFENVMWNCFRPAEEGNWLTPHFVRVYTQIHLDGWAHSAECWSEDELVGGVYGLALGGCFCAESMFHRRTDASKVALWALVNRCRELGFTLFDAQIMNPHLQSLGAYEITNAQYLRQLRQALKIRTEWSPPPAD
jgi:leucyl/phenylalanyl-tRNA--protein transferase